MSLESVGENENYLGFIEKSAPLLAEEGKSLSMDGIRSQLNFLLGDVLTIIDASTSDLIQRKALKDLIKTKVWDRMRYIQDLVGLSTTGSKLVTNKEA